MGYPNFNTINCEQKLVEIKYFLNKENLTDKEKFISIFNVCKKTNVVTKKYNLHDIARFVCEFSGMTFEQITSRTRKREIITIRQIAHYMSHRFTNETLFSIADYWGNFTHCASLHSIKAVKKDLKNRDFNDRYYEFISNPEEYLKERSRYESFATLE